MSLAILQQRLQEIHSSGLTRNLSPVSGVDFCSNDYLGFSQDEVLRKNFLQRLQHFPIGAAGSRLLRGNHAIYEETEALLADFVKREVALLFPSGYQANLALLSALLKEGDYVFSDEFNHASIIDGIRLTKATRTIFPHRDYQYLEDQLKTQHTKPGLKIIVSESLFSMEGTLANVKDLALLAEKYNALLIIDEAHSTGVFGASLIASLGLTEKVFATIHTGGKALGVSGAWIAGNALLKKYLINVARPFLFTTAPISALALLLQEAIKHYQQVGSERAAAIFTRVNKIRQLLAAFINDSVSGPIVPIIIGENFAATKVAAALQQRAWDVRAIRPPTVPIGTARLRLTIKWSNSEQQIEELVRDIKREILR